MTPSRLVVAVLGCSASMLATGCGEGDVTATQTSTAAAPAPGPAVRSAKVDIASFRFVPDTITLEAGGRVTWVNRDRAPHTAENTGEEGAPATFDSGRLTQGQRKKITFAEPGTYTYYCVYHRFMEANVIVR